MKKLYENIHKYVEAELIEVEERSREAEKKGLQNELKAAEEEEDSKLVKEIKAKLAEEQPGIEVDVEDYLESTIEANRKRGIYWFKLIDGLTLDDKEVIESLRREKDLGNFEGLNLVYSQERFYPEIRLAANVIGFSDEREDGSVIGRSGIEDAWNGNLEPQKGYVTFDIDAAGNPVTGSTDATIQAKRGSTIVTTIDKYLQQKVEQYLERGVKQFKAASGTTIVLDPKSGEIMAMANYPSFDPNTRDVDNPAHLGNAAVSQPYEIGSVGKAFTLAAAIDSGLYKPGDVVIQGHDGCEALIEGFQVCNLFGRKSGPLTLSRATVKSDNVAYYHISKDLGPETLHSYLVKFGVGFPSGVDLRGESYGYIKTPETWNENDISAYSYGTSYQMNAIQAASAVAALGNNGVADATTNCIGDN